MSKNKPKNKKDGTKNLTFHDMSTLDDPGSETDFSNEDTPGRKIINDSLKQNK